MEQLRPLGSAVALLVHLACLPPAASQNPCDLITNGGFEALVSCPTEYYNGSQCVGGNWIGSGNAGGVCMPWIQVTYGSVDIWSTCYDPLSLVAADPAHSGDNFLGFLPHDDNPAPGWWEYFEQQLSSPMVAEQSYCVTFWARVDGLAYQWANNPSTSIDLMFTADQIAYPDTFYYGQLSGLVSDFTWLPSQAPLPGHGYTPWEEVNFTYIATGGEQWFTLGHLGPNGTGSYANIDDISILPVTAAPTIATTNSCNGACTAVASTGPAMPMNWFDANGDTLALATDSMGGLCPGSYTAVPVGCGCSAVPVAFTIVDGECLAAELIVDTACHGDASHVSALVSGGTSPYQFIWQPAVFNGEGPFATVLDSTTSIHLLVIDAAGDSAQVAAVALIVQPPVAAFSVDTLSEMSFQFIDLSTDAVAWHWSFGDGAISGLRDPQHAYAQNGLMNVLLQVENTAGCMDTAGASLFLDVEPTLFVPNGFTPNADGINDVFAVVSTFMSEMELLIFDRWGEQIMAAKGPPLTWDGTYRGKRVQDGVYVWRVTGKRVDRLGVLRTGHVVVLQ